MHAHRPRRGAGLTEYSIILVLVAIAIIVAVMNFGFTHQEKYMGSEISVDAHLDIDAP